jgi:hypothetical protein
MLLRREYRIEHAFFVALLGSFSDQMSLDSHP